MAKFRIVTRTEITSNFSGISLNEYQVDDTTDKERVITEFLKPEHFKHEDFHSIIRYDKENVNGYLGHALNLEQITLADFKKLGKTETLAFFDATLPKDPATQSAKDERHLLDKMVSLIEGQDSEDYYVISKHFFDTSLSYEAYFENEKLLYDAIIYEPYYLVIWFDKKNNLNVCEFLSD